MSAERANAFGAWRGRPVDGAVTYPAKDSFESIAASDWHISTFNGVPGRLIYGLPLLPSNGQGTLADVGAGKYDWVWRKVASDLVANGRGDSVVRIGLEANGDAWFRWGATAATAGSYRAAYRRVASVMRATAPKLLTEFDIVCARPLSGALTRMAALDELYPGDDVVDIVGCDNYDQWTTASASLSTWEASIRPVLGPGLTDVASFARRHGKGFAIPEWGVITKGNHGNGDNPFYIEMMHKFMMTNRDIMTFEGYFNQDDPELRSSLWEGGSNPRAAAAYRRLFGAGS